MCHYTRYQLCSLSVLPAIWRTCELWNNSVSEGTDFGSNGECSIRLGSTNFHLCRHVLVGPPRYQEISWPDLEADRFLSYWISLNLVFFHVVRTSLRLCAPDQVQYCFTLRRVFLLSPILVSRISLLRIRFHPVLWIP